MNSKDRTEGTPETGVQPSDESNPETWCHHNTENMKREYEKAIAKKLIERYFYQLIDGCGNPNCNNEYCASSGKIKNLTRNQAAAQAFQLFSREAKLCEIHPSKMARTQTEEPSSTEVPENLSNPSGSAQIGVNQGPNNSKALNSKNSSESEKSVPFLTEEKLKVILEKCHREDSYAQLIRVLGEVYSNPKSLSLSFLKKEPETPLEAMLEKAGEKDLKSLKKEDVRILEGDLDKDEDCQETHLSDSSKQKGELSSNEKKVNKKLDDITVDIISLRRAYDKLFALSSTIYGGALVTAIVALMNELEIQLKLLGKGNCIDDDDLVNIFIIITEIPLRSYSPFSEFFESVLPHMCKVAAHMSIPCQAKLARVWARYCGDRLKNLLDSVQQLITLKILIDFNDPTSDYCIQDEEAVTAPTKFMKIIYYASILGGDLDPPHLREEDPPSSAASQAVNLLEEALFGGGGGEGGGSKMAPRAGASAPSRAETQPVDPLEAELKVTALDSRKPLIPFQEFYNQPLSDSVEMDKDFTLFKSDLIMDSHKSKKFSFMNYSFILTPATKILGLYYDNRIRMYNERRMSLFQAAVGHPANPYLKLKVKRDHVIEDALVELEMIALENPKDLKKQLVVEFEGEQGVDEGGISKEFFQLVTEEIFKPDYGMFVHQPETDTVWFNPTSFENDAQFTLIGIVVGLAIYNNVILDMRFPMVLYKKLMGKKGTYYDLQDWNPTLFSGLKQLLEYEEDDIEEMFLISFKVCYTDVFGTTLYHELKENGDQILVNQDNKQEFVDLYADFLLNKCVEKQFRAFRNGFQMVTDESPLSLLFRPEEIEQLVCGSKNFDFDELENATEYDGGYAADTPVILNFWEIVHAMSIEDKRKLLQFATGSDRVPVGGLSRLKLIIARNGPDSDRLPTAHTCFNVLLLPEYSTREKLQDRLEKAINYSKGFGIL